MSFSDSNPNDKSNNNDKINMFENLDEAQTFR